MSPSAPRKVLTVGEVAARSGVPVSTIHFYEAQGLIRGWRTSGNQRRYERSILRRIAVIQVAQRAGLTLKAIADVLSATPMDRPVSADEWRQLTQSWRSLLDERIKLLERLRDEIDSCIGCGCLSLSDCPLRNPDDRLNREGAGAVIMLR